MIRSLVFSLLRLQAAEATKSELNGEESTLLLGLGATAHEALDMARELAEQTCRMVWSRMAKTGNSRESRMTYDEWLATGEPFDPNALEEEE